MCDTMCWSKTHLALSSKLSGVVGVAFDLLQSMCFVMNMLGGALDLRPRELRWYG